MDPGDQENLAQPDERIAALINEYFDRRRIGEELTPESFSAEHPDLAEALRPYLAGLSLLEKIRPPASETAGMAPKADPPAVFPTIEGLDVLEEIGRGGMGVVYKALQQSTKRIVALKVMLAGPFASDSALRRFKREVELAARMQHPSIVRVLESGEVMGVRYYAMDYVVGVPLDRHLGRSQLGTRDVLRLFEHLCDAVDYAHRHGVVHRDLKPGNVLIDEDGCPHILDFGLAKATDPSDATKGIGTKVSLPGQVVGTLAYLSPEQASGLSEEVDTRTDVYALGVMLFESLTGKLPYDMSGRPSQVIQRIRQAAPLSPRSLSPSVDDELETITLKALEKEKDRRYQSAGELSEDLRRYLEGEPILAKRPSSFYFIRKKMIKHRWAAIVGAGAVALSLIILVAETRWTRQDLAQARRDAVITQRGIDSGDVGFALGNARSLHARHPELAEARLVWAQAQFRSENTRAGGILFLERQLQRDPSQWACRALLADIYRATRNLDRANALLAHEQHDVPSTAEAWYIRSYATLDRRQAVAFVRQAVQRDPLHRLAWRRLAYLRRCTGDLEGALRSADRLLELGGDPAEWTLFKGQVLAINGRFREAIQQYSLTVEGDSDRIPAYLFRAHAYRRVKEYDKAVADYSRLINREQGTANAWILYQRATPLWILGRTEEALEDYRRVRNRLGYPFYSDARRFLILRENGRNREAQDVLDAALRDVRNVWLRLIFLCLAGQYTPDELVADAIARANREHICEAWYYAGEVHLLIGQADQARRSFEQCVRTGVAFDLDTELATPMNEFELAQWRLETLLARIPTPNP